MRALVWSMTSWVSDLVRRRDQASSDTPVLPIIKPLLPFLHSPLLYVTVTFVLAFYGEFQRVWPLCRVGAMVLSQSEASLLTQSLLEPDWQYAALWCNFKPVRKPITASYTWLGYITHDWNGRYITSAVTYGCQTWTLITSLENKKCTKSNGKAMLGIPPRKREKINI